METITIHNYSFTKPLTCENSGFSKWGIGTYNEKYYFVKEFLSPVYPAENSIFTEEKRQKRIRLCQSFIEEKNSLYKAVREADDGHIIAVEQFFRFGAKFYISTKAVTDPILSISDIASCSFADKLLLCCSIAHAMSRIHEKKIVHADIKPDNILVIRKNNLHANIIDFDCGFFESNCPKLGEELNGDLVYLSPEGFLHIADIESNLSCKMDVFALGLLFHQYFTGRLPEFDISEYQYPYESVLDDHPLIIQHIDSMVCSQLFEKMLLKNPQDRPDMQSVFEILNKHLLEVLNRNNSVITIEKNTSKTIEREPVFSPTNTNTSQSYFQSAGDLL